MESKKISARFFGIGLLFLMLYFIIPIQYFSYWFIFSWGLIIQITSSSITFLYLLNSFFYLPFGLAMFIICLISTIIYTIAIRKKEISEKFYKPLRKMTFIIGSLATGAVLLLFILGHLIVQIYIFLYNQSFFSILTWIVSWSIFTSLVIYLISGIIIASKSSIKLIFRSIWIICGMFVPIPLFFYSVGFTIAIFFPFIGMAFMYLEQIFSNRKISFYE